VLALGFGLVGVFCDERKLVALLVTLISAAMILLGLF
jgi:hypothetical protein